MDNVISFPSREEIAKQQGDPVIGDPVIEFVSEHLIPWAIENGLDVSSKQFRLNGATIMTCLQGMFLNDI